MTEYIATFHTHFSAMCTHRALRRQGILAALAPVPRSLSSSCGTCLRYRADQPHAALMHRDFERIVAVLGDKSFVTVAKND